MERIADILSSNLSLDELTTIYYFIYAVEMLLFFPILIPAAPMGVFWRRWFSTRKISDSEARDRGYWFVLLCVFTFVIWIPISIAAFEGTILLSLLQESIPNDILMSLQSILIRFVFLGIPTIFSLIMTFFQNNNNIEKQ